MGRFKQEKCGLRGILATTQIVFFDQKKLGKLTQNSGNSTNIWHWPSDGLGTEDVTKNRWSGQKAACFPMVFPHRCLQQGISSVAWIKYVQVISNYIWSVRLVAYITSQINCHVVNSNRSSVAGNVENLDTTIAP